MRHKIGTGCGKNNAHIGHLRLSYTVFMKKRQWEPSVESWLVRHNVPRETIDLFMPFLIRKVQMVELEAMRAIVRGKEELRYD